MKHFIRTASAFLCAAILLLAIPFPFAQASETQEAVFDLEKQVMDWGEGISRVHIRFSEEIDPAGVDASTFAVGAAAAQRVITLVETAGNEVILTLKTGQQTTGVNFPMRNYVITQNKTLKTVSGTELPPGTVTYLPGEEFNAETAAFAYETSDSGMNYRIYTPPLEKDKKYAVLFWLHGYQQGGSDNEKQIVGSDVPNFTSAEIQSKFGGMYVVAPQNPEDEETWSWMQTDESGRSSSLPALISLIKEVIAENRIDPDRVYIGGFSAGGFMTWHTILEYADLFAAAIPVCSAYAPTSAELEAVKDLPIWIVHSASDPVCPVANSKNAYDSLRLIQKNNQVRYTEYPNVTTKDGTAYNGHFSWIYVCANYYSPVYTDTYMDWLSRQTKNKADASFDVEAESFDYGEDVTKIVIDMKEDVDPTSVTAATFAVAVKDYSSYNWQTRKATTIDSVSRKVTGISVDGRYVTLELEHGYGKTGASTLMYDGGAWRNIPIELRYELTQTAGFRRADGSAVDVGDKTYEQKRVYNRLVDRFDAYKDVSGISYALYEPEQETGKKYPLIVWLHGAGEGGYNNKVQIRGNKVVGLIADEVQALFANGGAFVLAPQSPTGWMEDNDQNNRSDYLEDVIALIERTIDDEKVDAEKVYIGGCSMGGYMTWNVILTRPDLFAAAFPVCPAYLPSVAELEAVVDLPIWIVHSADDTTVNPAQFSRLTVAALQNLGGDIRYTEFKKTDYNGHWSWQYVFNNFHSDEYGETIMQWVAAHDRAQNAAASAAEEAAETSPSSVPSEETSASPSASAAPEGSGNSTGYVGVVMIVLVAAVLIVSTVRNLSRKKPGAKK